MLIMSFRLFLSVSLSFVPPTYAFILFLFFFFFSLSRLRVLITAIIYKILKS